MDIASLLACFNARQVDYVVIGALMKEAAGRPKDLDGLKALRRLRDRRG